MATSRSSIGVPPHSIDAIHMVDKRAIDAELVISVNGATPRHSITDDGADTCGDLDIPNTGKPFDVRVDSLRSQRVGRSSSRDSQLPLRLPSRDLHSSGRDLHPGVTRDIAESNIQTVLPGFEQPAKRPARKHHRRASVNARLVGQEDEHVCTYVRRLSALGRAAKGILSYKAQLRATVRAASRLRGSSIGLLDLFCDVPLLGSAIVDDTSIESLQLSKWTLAQRRSAIRSFANVMRPELLKLLGEEPRSVVDRALRLVAERIGGGYRLTGGAPRRRGGHAPDRGEIAAVLQCLGSTPGYTGLRNWTFFSILAASGCRVNALRQLDGKDCLVLPNGRVRLYLHEKGKAEQREVELSNVTAHALIEYVSAFNQLAVSRRWKCRVQVGKPGAIWRNSAGNRWGYAAALAALKTACSGAGVPEFSPHALRRAFASDATSLLPRHVVAQAGGWKGLDRLDNHYVQPRDATVWEKLTRVNQVTTIAPTETEKDDATVVNV